MEGNIKQSVKETNNDVKKICTKCKKKRVYIGSEFTEFGIIKQYKCDCGLTEIQIHK